MVDLPLTLPDSLVPYEPSASRELQLFGAPVELALLPGRRLRAGAERRAQPPFQRSPAPRIIEEESYWRDGALALTPNKFPFARDQRILWVTEPAREPDGVFWQAALKWVDRADGTVLLNNIGAAATIARAHAHLVGERLPFLEQVREQPLTTAPIEPPAGCELIQKRLSRCVLGVRGPVAGRARALELLADARTTATWNVVLTRDAAWVIPRAQQTPEPHLGCPMGAAEFWGRFCFVDEGPFAAANASTLGAAWEQAAAPAIG
ncbi:MAG: hypothetical protein VX044_08670 [Planctomycetota bacterium]|nr:hypothetical protein [Planctomycetota bacterium]